MRNKPVPQPASFPLSNPPAESEVARDGAEGRGWGGADKAGIGDATPRSWETKAENIGSLGLPLAI